MDQVKHCAVYRRHEAIADLFRVSCSACTWRAEHCLPADEALAAFTAHRDGLRKARHWLNWTQGEFDASAPDTQLCLVAAPDPLGTPDMFGGQL